MKRIEAAVIVLWAAVVLWPGRVAATGWWEVQSVDTMKYSRDLARTENDDPAFDREIEIRIKNIAATGATHVAIDTPYDREFVPFLRRWVKMARKYYLKVWFRGNWSGWEGWFDYGLITREEHIKKTAEFIAENKDLFADGDIFTACPECENGGPGDPRWTGDVKGFRQFMIDEYKATSRAFAEAGFKAAVNYNSMNGDVARLVMDKATTQAMGGLVVIDHYVKTPEKLAADVREIAESSGGRVVLGEFGVPIPDITGSMNQSQQAQWLESALSGLARLQVLSGVNYWVDTGGTTQLWTASGSALEGAKVLADYYNPPQLFMIVRNQLGQSLEGAKVVYRGRTFITGDAGQAIIPVSPDTGRISVTLEGYKKYDMLLGTNQATADVVLRKGSENLIFKIRKLVYWIWGRI
jgi:hypothetical protein